MSTKQVVAKADHFCYMCNAPIPKGITCFRLSHSVNGKTLNHWHHFGCTQMNQDHVYDEKTNVVLNSTWGSITADSITGNVVEFDLSGDWNNDFPHKLNLEEWKTRYPGEAYAGNEHDVLDFGYWYINDAGEEVYEEPCVEWRQDREDMRNDIPLITKRICVSADAMYQWPEQDDKIHIAFSKGCKGVCGTQMVDKWRLLEIGEQIQLGQLVGLPVYSSGGRNAQITTAKPQSYADLAIHPIGYVYIRSDDAFDYEESVENCKKMVANFNDYLNYNVYTCWAEHWDRELNSWVEDGMRWYGFFGKNTDTNGMKDVDMIKLLLKDDYVFEYVN